MGMKLKKRKLKYKDMKIFVSIISMLLFSIGAFAQGYKNPVLPGFHADTSCR